MLTGESDCPGCGQRVLRVLDYDGRLVDLEPERTDGGWEPSSRPGSNKIVAKYVSPDQVRERRGHHAHALRCKQRQLAESRRRIEDATTEQGEQPVGSETVLLPVLDTGGVRELVRRRA